MAPVTPRAMGVDTENPISSKEITREGTLIEIGRTGKGRSTWTSMTQPMLQKLRELTQRDS